MHMNSVICPECGEEVRYDIDLRDWKCKRCGWSRVETKNDKDNKNLYKEVKNVIHNDLGITKEYIDGVIKKTIHDEITKLMDDDCFIRGLVEKEVMSALRRKDSNTWHTLHDASTFIKEEITSAILENIKDRLEIRFKDDECNGNYNIDDFEVVQNEDSGYFGVRPKADSITVHKVGDKDE